MTRSLTTPRVGQRPLLPADIDTDLVLPAWRPAVYANRALDAGAVDRDAYVVCVLEQLFTEEPTTLRVATAFDELALAI